MKILHVSCVAPPQTGGIGTAASEAVKRLRSRGHEAMLIAPALKTPLSTSDPEYVKRLPAFLRFGNAASLSGLTSWMKWADVIHLSYPFMGTAETIAQYALWHKRTPLVLWFHMDATGGNPVMQFAFELYRILAQPVVLHATSRVIVSSKDYAEQSSLQWYMKSHPDRVEEVPYGVDDRFFTGGTSREIARESFGLPQGVKVVGFVGGMDMAHPFKGIDELLTAMSQLLSDHHALLVGEGDRRRVYEARAKELGIEDRTHFTGWLPNERLPEAYSAMDVFAFPSTSKAEAFGIVAADAQACGVPVIASSLPGVRRVVLDRRTGIHIPPKDAGALKDAILKLTSNDELRKFYSKEAKDWATERFNWDRSVDRFEEIYREVCGSRS